MLRAVGLDLLTEEYDRPVISSDCVYVRLGKRVRSTNLSNTVV